MTRRGPLNKLKLIGIKGGQNGEKPIFLGAGSGSERRREGVERESLTFL